MSSILGQDPYPWVDPAAQQLHLVLTRLYPTQQQASRVAAQAGIDLAFLDGQQPPFWVWYDILELAANGGLTPNLVAKAHDLSKEPKLRPFLDDLLSDRLDPAAWWAVLDVDGPQDLQRLRERRERLAPASRAAWPVVVGASPPQASAFQPRTPVVQQMDAAQGTVVLSGGGGTGKSQIAAAAFRSSTADLRLWVTAESATAVVSGYADAAAQLGLGDADDIGPEQLARRFLRFLATTPRSWVVVLDDLKDPVELAGLWPSGAGRVVVTTRRRDAGLSASGRTMVDVEVYAADEAESYLVQRLSPMRERLPDDAVGEAGGLAADLGYLPLALAQAAAVIIDEAVSCGEYRCWFADRSQSLGDLFPAEADADGYAQTVATTWALAVETADQLEPVGMARRPGSTGGGVRPGRVPRSLVHRAGRLWPAGGRDRAGDGDCIYGPQGPAGP